MFSLLLWRRGSLYVLTLLFSLTSPSTNSIWRTEKLYSQIGPLALIYVVVAMWVVCTYNFKTPPDDVIIFLPATTHSFLKLKGRKITYYIYPDVFHLCCSSSFLKLHVTHWFDFPSARIYFSISLEQVCW